MEATAVSNGPVLEFATSAIVEKTADCSALVERLGLDRITEKSLCDGRGDVSDATAQRHFHLAADDWKHFRTQTCSHRMGNNCNSPQRWKIRLKGL